MKQRSALAATLLSLFVPFYLLYWFYVTAKELEAKGAKAPSIALLLAPFFLLILVFVIILGGTATNADEGTAGGLGAVMLIGLPFAIGLTLYYNYKFGEAVEQVTARALTKGLLFILFWFVAPAGVFLTQDKLNQLSEGQPPAAPTTEAPTTPVDTTATPPETPTPPPNPT